tara:strand:- start:633 stop:836 length:204 start_codon:yes stop_codon:yes gene_type:complete
MKVKKNIKYSLCTCGLSKKLPLCDNAHREYNDENKGKISFKSIKIRSNKDVDIDIQCNNWLENDKQN